METDAKTLRWIIGSGGLLGAAIRDLVGPKNLFCAPQIPWDTSERTDQLRQAASDFASTVKREEATRFEIYWCAGAGVVATGQDALDRENESLGVFLESLGNALPEVPARGVLFLSSSAGGVYAGCKSQPISERSPESPISPYGHSKLRQEQLVRSFAETHSEKIRVLVGRISNLYGPNQKLSKPQGLISQICRSILLREPIHVYVPLDTIRDYHFVGDCAEQIVELTKSTSFEREVITTKIFASEREASIAGVLGAFRRVVKQRPKVIMAALPLRSQQPLALAFRSCVAPVTPARTVLEVGIARVHAAQLEKLRLGRLPRSKK